jgi:hypothetical protein
VRTSLDELPLLLKTRGRRDEQLTADLGEAVMTATPPLPRSSAPPAPPGCDPVNVPAAPQLIVNVTVCGFSADALGVVVSATRRVDAKTSSASRRVAARPLRRGRLVRRPAQAIAPVRR